VLSKFRAFVVKGFDLLLWKSLGIKPKATPYHENTKKRGRGDFVIGFCRGFVIRH